MVGCVVRGGMGMGFGWWSFGPLKYMGPNNAGLTEHCLTLWHKVVHNIAYETFATFRNHGMVDKVAFMRTEAADIFSFLVAMCGKAASMCAEAASMCAKVASMYAMVARICAYSRVHVRRGHIHARRGPIHAKRRCGPRNFRQH